MFFQGKLTLHFHAELSPPDTDQSQKVTFSLQTTPQEDQSCFQIIFDVGQFEVAVEPDLLVCEVRLFHPDRKTRPFAVDVFKHELKGVLRQDFLDKGKPDALALRLGGKERREKVLMHVSR